MKEQLIDLPTTPVRPYSNETQELPWASEAKEKLVTERHRLLSCRSFYQAEIDRINKEIVAINGQIADGFSFNRDYGRTESPIDYMPESLNPKGLIRGFRSKLWKEQKPSPKS